ADILVGTQMIAKGHDFANVTLVGILEADAALYFSDYRSSERTFQLITQVAGRAGRAEKEGKVILQTYAPKHYVFRFGKTYDYCGFWKKEINTRMVTKFPPYTKIVRVLVTAEDEQVAVDTTRAIYKGIQSLQAEFGQFVYLGAQKAPIKRMNALNRYQVLMRILPNEFDLVIGKIYEITDSNKTKKGNCFVEINPQSMI
ncbi:MAG: primosomal protein N', partial [Clostridia bacterium]